MEFLINSAEQTISLGEKLGRLVNPGDIICIEGDLGTGKTQFTKGLARGLNVEDYITSPTFTIVNEYLGRLKLYHFDVYRVNDPDEIEAIGFDEYIFGEGVSVIEWANYIRGLIPNEYIEIIIEKQPALGENYRKLTINNYGDKYNYIKELSI